MGAKDISKTMVLKDGVTPTLKKINAGTVQYKKNLKDLKTSANNVWSSIKTGAKVATAAIGAAAAAIGGIGIKANASAEMAEKSFAILLQSADAAKVMVKDLQTLAAESPFEFAGLQDAAKTLLGMGFTGKQVVPMLRSLGDAVAAVGGNTDQMKGIALAIGQIQSKGKLSAEEVNQLAERGVPAWSLLAEQMGKTPAEIMKLAEQGKLLSNQVIPMLMQGLSKRFGGSMQEMSDTFEFTIANIRETATLKLAGITKPLFNEIKNDMQGIQGVISDNGVETWGTRLSNTLVTIYKGAKAVGGAVLDVANIIANNWKWIGPVVYGVAGAFIAYKIALIGARAKTMLMTAATWAQTKAQMGLNAAIKANPLGFYVTLIGLAIAAGTYLIRNWDQVKLVGMKTWNVVVGATEWAVNALLSFANFMISTFAFAWDSIEFAGKSIWNGIISAGEAGVNGFIGLIEKMVEKAVGGINILIGSANKVSESLGLGNVVNELTFDGLGRVDFSGAKAAVEKPKWEYGEYIQKVNFSGTKFSDDSIIAQTRKAQAKKAEKEAKQNDALIDALEANTAATAANSDATIANTSATNANTKATLTGGGGTALDIADSLLARLERHLWGT